MLKLKSTEECIDEYVTSEEAKRKIIGLMNEDTVGEVTGHIVYSKNFDILPYTKFSDRMKELFNEVISTKKGKAINALELLCETGENALKEQLFSLGPKLDTKEHSYILLTTTLAAMKGTLDKLKNGQTISNEALTKLFKYFRNYVVDCYGIHELSLDFPNNTLAEFHVHKRASEPSHTDLCRVNIWPMYVFGLVNEYPESGNHTAEGRPEWTLKNIYKIPEDENPKRTYFSHALAMPTLNVPKEAKLIYEK